MRKIPMRNAGVLLAAVTTALATPALAQANLGGTVDATVGANTGAVGSTLGTATDRLGKTVDRVDGTVNKSLDSTKLTLATREQVRAGAEVSDRAGNSIGTVQSIDGDNAIVVDGGKLYNIPLGTLYSKGAGAANGLVTKLPRTEITARAQGGAAVETR